MRRRRSLFCARRAALSLETHPMKTCCNLGRRPWLVAAATIRRVVCDGLFRPAFTTARSREPERVLPTRTISRIAL